MRPILTPHEMREIDAAAIAAGTSEATLIERAGWAVARRARSMLGGTYGRRVTVIAGRGNNGADGRVAARFLTERGIRVRVIDADEAPEKIEVCDLVIDAAYGTGFRGTWNAPLVAAPVLAVDLPSGLDGVTGIASGRVLAADATITFAALKPGLLFGDGPLLSGEVEVVDIGLDVSTATTFAVEASDVVVPARAIDAHKWRSGVLAVAGSDGMHGAASLCSEAALRAGAGIVHLIVPGESGQPRVPREVVTHRVGPTWSREALDVASRRFGSLVVGPGLGRAKSTIDDVRRLVGAAPIPTIVDGDALFAIGHDHDVVRNRLAATVLTPHDGEYAYLMGGPPAADRMTAARELAASTKAVCLLKGPSTVVASPDGRAAVVDEGDQRLATAGSGDVLSGVVAALLAAGVDSFAAAYSAAWIHARAARRGRTVGLLAGDLPVLVADVLATDVTTTNIAKSGRCS